MSASGVMASVRRDEEEYYDKWKRCHGKCSWCASQNWHELCSNPKECHIKIK